MKEFRGTITDVGGPTANLYAAKCPRWLHEGPCGGRECLMPEKCKRLGLGYKESMELYRAILALPRVKHMFIESGIRYDLLVEDDSTDFLEYLCAHHVSGQMKVAPEHTVDSVLRIMNKPGFHVYEKFRRKFNEVQKRIRKDQYLVNYFISSHPGATLEDEQALSSYLRGRRMHPEQVQDFTPLPSTVSGCMYHTGVHPLTGEKVHVARSFEERRMHRALVQYENPAHRRFFGKALKLLATGVKR